MASPSGCLRGCAPFAAARCRAAGRSTTASGCSLQDATCGASYECAMAGAQKSTRERREAIVREHMESENRHDFDTTIATFAHPHYEIIPTGDVYDGEDAVRRYFAETRAAFPDQRNELIAL